MSDSKPLLKFLLSSTRAVGAPRKFHLLSSVANFFVTILFKYAPSYYRATWINTGLDAGFATAMNIRQKWLRDICSIIFSVYYIIYANEADEKVRLPLHHDLWLPNAPTTVAQIPSGPNR